MLRDLRDLRILVLHPQNAEGVSLADHLRRIGCHVQCQWPLPARLPDTIDAIFLAIEDDAREDIVRFLRDLPQPTPPILAIVSYENPAMLQVVLESGALAVIERPIKPFGLLTNLTIARTLWLERQKLVKEVRKYKRKVHGDQKMARAKAILMSAHGLSENDAYQEMRRQAMESRIPIEQVANAVIEAENHLRPANKHG
jgi:AmiR/NasT family two-component response regulator